MKNNYNPYINQAIEIAENSKRELTISRDLIESIKDDRLLGVKVRLLFMDKIKECDQYIEHMKSLKEK